MFTGLRTRLRNFFTKALAVYMGLRDPSVPRLAKIIGVASLLYLVFPMDFIPDVIPVVGWLDDMAILPIAVHIMGKIIPLQLMRRLEEDAERTIMRWGPRVFYYGVGFIVLWILLMGVGGWHVWQELRRTNQAQTAPRPIPFPTESPVTLPSSDAR